MPPSFVNSFIYNGKRSRKREKKIGRIKTMEKDKDETEDSIDITEKYNLLITHGLEWPSLTVEWLPDRDVPQGKDYSVQKMILGTHPLWKTEPNYLMIAQVLLPLEDSEFDIPDADGFGFVNTNKVKIIQYINHDGEVNRARYMPQNPLIIATKAVSSEVYVFDYSKHTSQPPSDGACNPDLRLRGHNAEGFGLSWSKFRHGHLLSGSNDAQICLWDINATPHNKTLRAMQIFKVHEGFVADVAWHMTKENLFGSVGGDRNLYISDLRLQSTNKPAQLVIAHQSKVNCLAFNPFDEWLVATGSSDKTVKLFDLRKIETTFHTFNSHKEGVFRVGWNPKNATTLASACHGGRLMVWDRSRIGKEQTVEDAEDGSPELLFIHESHTSKISDFSWNPCEDWVVASVADDDAVQIWQMAENIYHDEDDDLPEESTKPAA